MSFQKSTPAQPIITGRVYNAIQVPPGNLPSTRPQMHIRSKTYKDDGYNSIMFDDATNQELFEMHAERDMHTIVEHDQKNHIKNDRTLKVDSTQTTTIGKGRTETIITGNQVKSVLAGNDITTVSNLKSTQAREIFKYAQDRIELEVGEQTSITMDNEKILLRFGKNTILMDKTGIWIDGVHIGLQEKELDLPNNAQKPNTEEKCIVDLYWSYGDEEIRLNEKSRHYSDLNLHIVTQNYQEGENVEAVIEYDTEQGKETFNVLGVVEKSGVAIVKNVFENKVI